MDALSVQCRLCIVVSTAMNRRRYITWQALLIEIDKVYRLHVDTVVPAGPLIILLCFFVGRTLVSFL
jgi:hypothetical protein